MAETHHKKQQITTALAQARLQIHNEGSSVWRTLDLKHRSLESIRTHPWEWLAAPQSAGGFSPEYRPAKKESILRA